MKKQKLFEWTGGNSFKIALPQPMGMMHEISQGRTVRLTLARKPETNEWLVKVYINGKYNENATYYTDDKQDAIDTAKTMLQLYQNQGFETETKPIGNIKETQISTEQLQQMWEEDQQGEYIQINPDNSVYFIANGRAKEQITSGNTEQQPFHMISMWMKKNNFFPNVWQVNDHGNIELMDKSGNTLGGLV